ncbi:transcriptional regulator [Vibrio cholerae]|nr:transcriptional regulator [Vibrio cholerae]MCD1250398.1 transcriptional regulator [Vibrio cholerae]
MIFPFPYQEYMANIAFVNHTTRIKAWHQPYGLLQIVDLMGSTLFLMIETYGMNELQHWLHTIHHWYQHNDCAAVAELQPLIFGAPQALWQPELNSTQSKAIACWLDACLRQFEFYRETDTEKALQYLNLAYGRFQLCAAQPECDLELKSWCLLRMQQLMVLSLEHLNHQVGGESQSHALIDAHVRFMAFHAWNDDQGTRDPMRG